MATNKQALNSDQERFIRMSAQGKSRAEILKEVFHLDIETASDNAIHNADSKMSRWRKHPDYEKTWKDEVKDILFGCTAEAVQVIRGQLVRADLPWLQNKAANDLLNYGKQQIYGDEDKAVTVQVVGMPELGCPDLDD